MSLFRIYHINSFVRLPKTDVIKLNEYLTTPPAQKYIGYWPIFCDTLWQYAFNVAQWVIYD